MSKNARLKMEDFKRNGGRDVFLRASAFDLRPAVDAILERVEKVRESLNGRPLVVLMGEDHRVSSHVLLQQLILAKIHQKYGQQAGFATELPYNIAARGLAQRGHPPNEIKSMIASDDDGQLSLRESLETVCFDDAVYSHTSLLRHCEIRKISTCFADAAFDPMHYKFIDLDDEQNCLYMGRYTKETLYSPDSQSPIGVNLRNSVMCGRMAAHLFCSDVQILVAGVGAAHVFGHRKYGFQNSLAALFDRAGIPFIAVIPLGREIKISALPTEAARCFQQTIGVLGMDEKLFPRGKTYGELEYISKVIQQSGQGSRIVTSEMLVPA